MIPTSAITDAERAAFLRKLDNSDLNVSDWESSFLGSFMGAASFFWTDARRVAVDKMRMKYGSEPEIKMPFPLAETSSVKLADADPTGCEFMVRLDGRQQRCNDPAEFRRQNGFRYCSAHADAVQRDLKRQGKTIHLIRL